MLKAILLKCERVMPEIKVHEDFVNWDKTLEVDLQWQPVPHGNYVKVVSFSKPCIAYLRNVLVKALTMS
jgi:hypothetical protein